MVARDSSLASLMNPQVFISIRLASSGFSAHNHPAEAKLLAMTSESAVFLVQPRDIRWNFIVIEYLSAT